MPGRLDIPERPHRKRTRNPDRLRYVSGGIAHVLGGVLFGLPFFSGGLLCLATVVAAFFGISEAQADQSTLRWIIGVMAVTTIGLGHSIVGFLLLRSAVCSP